MAEERAVIIRQVVDLSLFTLREDLRAFGWDELPPWAEPHVAKLAELGICQLDGKTIDQLYRQVIAYRDAFGIEGSGESGNTHVTESMLGPRPDNPSVRIGYQLLEHKIAGSIGVQRAPETIFR